MTTPREEAIIREAAEDCVSRVPNVEEYSDIILSAFNKATEGQDEMCEQLEDYHRLVSFFRNEGYSEFGFHGDEAGTTPAGTAIAALKDCAKRHKYPSESRATKPQEWCVVNITGDHWDLRRKDMTLIWSARGIDAKPMMEAIANFHNSDVP